MRSRLCMVLLILSALLPLPGCSSPGAGLPPLEAAKSDDANYKLGPGDKLHIQVLGAEDMTGDYSVGDNGAISSPLIGEVRAAGLSRAELEREMARRLADGYMRNPKVSVSILTYRPIYIYGEVTKPGEYPYASGMRVMSAVATAGGYTYRANESFVVVTRKGEERKALPNTPLQPDDVIKVPERYF
jgi:polysaccharide biosynthesis/export protein